MKSDLKEIIESEELLTMDGYADCILGIGYRAGANNPYVVYSTQKIIKKLMKDGMTYEEAYEFHEFNQACAWFGEKTPAFVDTY